MCSPACSAAGPMCQDARARTCRPGPDRSRRLAAVGLLRHGRLAVRGLVLVDDALAGGLVEQPRRGPEGGCRGVRVSRVSSRTEPAYGGLELALDCFVAQTAALVGADALDLALDVGHAGSTSTSLRNRSKRLAAAV